MDNQKKYTLFKNAQITAYILWGASITIGALIRGSDGSTAGGAFAGFLVGLGIAIIISFLIRVIEDPRRLFYFGLAPIGMILGFTWGEKGAYIGGSIGALIAFLAIADMLKKK